MSERPGYNPDQEISEDVQEKIRHIEQYILFPVGLTFDDLRDKETVVDLGAGTAHLEEAARLQGINNIISIDNDPEALQYASNRLSGTQPPDIPGRVVADANALPLPDRSVDLIIGSHFSTAVERRGQRQHIFEEIERVLRDEGEARIYPARLSEMRKSLMDEHGIDNTLRAKRFSDCTPDEQERVNAFEQDWTSRSTALLRELGYTIEVNDNGRSSGLAEKGFHQSFQHQHYWVIRKRGASSGEMDSPVGPQ